MLLINLCDHGRDWSHEPTHLPTISESDNAMTFSVTRLPLGHDQIRDSTQAQLPSRRVCTSPALRKAMSYGSGDFTRQWDDCKTVYGQENYLLEDTNSRHAS